MSDKSLAEPTSGAAMSLSGTGLPETEGQNRLTVSVLMAFIVGGALLGVGFLSSMSEEAGRAAQEKWAASSLLKPIYDALAMNYEYPTDDGVAVKDLVHGIGGCVVFVLGAVAWYLSARSKVPGFPGPDRDNERKPGRTMSPTLGGQLLLGLFVVWSFLASQWSHAPAYAVGAATVGAIGSMWAFGVGMGCSRRHVPALCGTIVLASFLMACLNLWHHYELRPDEPTGFPMGHPGVLGTWMAAGAVAGAGMLRPCLTGRSGRPEMTRRLCAAGLMCLMWVCMWAMWLTGDWPSKIGLAAGAACLLILKLGRRGQVATILGVLLLSAGGVVYAIHASHQPGDPLGNEVRLHGYAWKYAGEMIGRRRMTGLGPGGYLLYGDVLAGNDVLRDPAAFGEDVLGHARSYWLETWCDTGLFGLVFLVGGIGLSIWGTLSRPAEAEGRNGACEWVPAVVSALVAVLAAETFGEGLFRSGLPTLFFVLLGLTWTLSEGRGLGELSKANIPGAVRAAPLAVSVLLSFVFLRATILDWTGSLDAYNVDRHLRSYDFDRAMELAASASDTRLRCSRRLDAQMKVVGVYSRIAQDALVRGLKRLAAQRGPDQPATGPVGLAREDLEIALGASQKGLGAAQSLQQTAPAHRQLGWETANLWDAALRADAALHPERQAVTYPTEAREALQQENRRYPFDPTVASRLSHVSIGAVSLPQQLTVLCGPLRLGRLTQELKDAIQELARQDGFEVLFSSVGAEAARTVADGPQSWSHPMAPEILLVKGMLDAQRRDFSGAQDALRCALAGGGQYEEWYPGGAAVLRETLAEVLFLGKPPSLQAAMEVLQPALHRVPKSGEEQAHIARLSYQMATYLLAGGQEAVARSLLAQLSRAAAGGTIDDAALGLAYAQLATRVASILPSDQRPAEWRVWVERARSLAPSAQPVLVLAARIAYEARDDEAYVKALRELRRNSSNMAMVRRLLTQALELMPTSKLLKDYEAELIAMEQESADSAPDHVPQPTPVPGGP